MTKRVGRMPKYLVVGMMGLCIGASAAGQFTPKGPPDHDKSSWSVHACKENPNGECRVTINVAPSENACDFAARDPYPDFIEVERGDNVQKIVWEIRPTTARVRFGHSNPAAPGIVVHQAGWSPGSATDTTTFVQPVPSSLPSGDFVVIFYDINVELLPPNGAAPAKCMKKGPGIVSRG